MELPIRIMIVLFVAVTVGGMIIMFSQRTMNDARVKLNEQFLEENQDKIVEVGELTDENLLGLANACIKKSIGVVFERELCFAVFAETWPGWSVLNNEPLEQGFTLDSSDPNLPAGSTSGAIRIMFDQTTSVVQIE